MGSGKISMGIDYVVISVMYDNNNYKITYADFKNTNIQNQILSTFKFTK